MPRSVVFDFIAKDRNYTGPLRRMESHTVRFGTSLGRFSGVAVRAFGGVGVAAAGVGVAAATMGIKTAANLEQAQIGFAQLLGSGKAAQKFMKQLSSFAARTPFELPGLIDAARGLVGAGTAAKDVIPILTALGDASGALGLDQERFGRVMIAVTQIMNKGKLQAEELMQITEAGIPIWPLLAKAMHKPVPELQKMMQHGDLLSKDVLPALFSQMHKDYGGAMEKQSRTLSGLWSTFMDTINIGLAQAIQPLEGELKTGLKGAIGIAQGALKGVADFMTNTVIPGLKTLKQWWENNKDAVGDVAKAFKDTFVPAAESATTKTDDLRTSAEKLSHKFTSVAIFAAELVKWWIETRIQTTTLMRAVYNLITAMGLAANFIDKLTGGSGHAADALVRFGRDGRRVADEDLAKLRQSAKDTQDAIDRMHGKDIPITGSLRLNFSPSFTQKDWVQVRLAAGRMAKGGLITQGTTSTADDVLIRASKRETIVSATDSADPWFKAWAGMRGIPGYARGGVIGQIDAETRAVNKVQAWGTGRRLDAGINKIMRMTGGTVSGFAGGAASGNVIRLALAQAKRMAASFKVALALIEAGIVESGLRNLPYGDRDSLGFLQQRPSQGWLHPMNISYAAWDFLRRAIPIQGRYGTAGMLAQAVQRSAFPFRYDAVQGRALGILNAYGYDQGGMLPLGVSMAVNTTGRPEPVGGHVTNIYVDRTLLARIVNDGGLRNARLA